MQEAAFATYMHGRSLADKTRQQRLYALKRIERAYGVDLDAEFGRDGLTSLLKTLSYSSADDRARASNPSKLDIEPDHLLTHLRWYKSHISDYAKFCGANSDDVEEVDAVSVVATEELIEDAVGRTFALERDMQAALRANLAQLEDGLTVADSGTERKVEAGFIDILARDVKGRLTVIELKAESSKPESVAQILSYMGCIAEESRENVRGILVAADHHSRVKYAAKAVPDLCLKSYRFKFEFV